MEKGVMDKVESFGDAVVDFFSGGNWIWILVIVIFCLFLFKHWECE